MGEGNNYFHYLFFSKRSFFVNHYEFIQMHIFLFFTGFKLVVLLV